MVQGLQHDNIVRYLGTERTGSTLCIFLEYVPGGSLRQLLERFGRFDEALVRVYTRQLLLGLEYLHRNGIAHRDVKGANILLGHDGTIKVSRLWADTGRALSPLPLPLLHPLRPDPARRLWRLQAHGKRGVDGGDRPQGHASVDGP